MSRYVISCTKKAPGKGRPGKGHKHIVAVGGISPLPFRFSCKQVLMMIGAGDVFVAHGMERHRDATVRGWPHPSKGPGLRSFTDGEKDDNLGSLPECPAR
jgi:Protein of unknown function (DUF3892)